MGWAKRVRADKGHLLPEDEYSDWINALKFDQSTKVDEILSQAQPQQKEQLLNGTFVFEKKIPAKVQPLMTGMFNFRVTKPLGLTVINNSRKSLKILLDQQINIFQTDENGNNVIHILILLAYLDPGLEKGMNEMYSFLKETLELHQLKGLLLQTNNNGRRPLEMAAHLETFHLMLNIIRTEGVYFIHEKIDSIYSIDWYLVDEYERMGPSNRRWFSPLYSLMFLSYENLEKDVVDKLFSSKLVKNWTNLKMRHCLPYYIVWLLIRAMYVIAFIFIDAVDISPDSKLFNMNFNPESNTNKMTLNQTISLLTTEGVNTKSCLQVTKVLVPIQVYVAFSIYLLVHSVIIIIFDILELGVQICTGKINRFNTPRGFKNITANFTFYRISQFIEAILVVVGMLDKNLALLGRTSFLKGSLQNLIFISSVFGLIWSIFFFLQIAPWIGTFIIALQSMFVKLFKFLAVFLLFALPFTGAFSRLINQSKVEGSCPPEFSSIEQSFYSAFLIMLNALDLRKMEPQDLLSTYLLHFFYVFLTAILLINFLVALFSTDFSKVDLHQDVVFTIQRLTVSWYIEDRLNAIFSFCHSKRHLTNIFPEFNGSFAVPCQVICSNHHEDLDQEDQQTSNSHKAHFIPYMVT